MIKQKVSLYRITNENSVTAYFVCAKCRNLKFKKIFFKKPYMTARFLPVRGKAEKTLCTLTTEYTAHLIHSFCCSERASHTSGRTITVKTAGCFLLAEKY